MSKPKITQSMVLRKLSGILVLVAIFIGASIVSGDIKSVIRTIADFNYIIIPMIAIIILVSFRPTIKGFLGEKSVQRILSKLDKSKYKVLNNIMLDVNGKTTQIDHVVVSNFGLFVIETKNYKGWIIGDEYSEYWTQVIYKRKEKLYNPIRQNYGHVMALKEHLKDLGDMTIYSIISFSSNADLKVTTTTDVVYSARLSFIINKYSITESVSDNTKEEICNRLNSLNIHDSRVRRKHVQDISEKKDNVKSKVSSNICPRCGSTLVQRKGKYGEFTGCTGYPKCRYIVKV